MNKEAKNECCGELASNMNELVWQAMKDAAGINQTDVSLNLWEWN